MFPTVYTMQHNLYVVYMIVIRINDISINDSNTLYYY